MISKVEQLFITYVIGMLVGAGCAWWVQGLRIHAIEADHIKAKEEAVAEEKIRADQIGNDYAQVVQWLNEQKQGRVVTLVKELEKPVYRDPACTLPDSGRLLVNGAVREANAARVGHTVLPEAAGAAGADNYGRAAAVGGLVGSGVRGVLKWQGGTDQMVNGINQGARYAE